MSRFSSSTDSAGSPVEADPVPDRVVRVCSKCTRPLSVGERMFYFLEAVNGPALCRLCVFEQERELLSPPEPLPSMDPPGRPPYEGPLRPAAGRASERRPSGIADPGLVGPVARTQAPREESSPSFRVARSVRTARTLRAAASRYVEQDQMDEAILCLRELAFELSRSESAGNLSETLSGEDPRYAPGEGESSGPPLAGRRSERTGVLPSASGSPKGGSSSSVPVLLSSPVERSPSERS